MSWWVLSCSIWAGFVLAQRGKLGRGDVLQLLWGICSASFFLHFILHVDPGFKVQPPHRMHRTHNSIRTVSMFYVEPTVLGSHILLYSKADMHIQLLLPFPAHG